MSYLNKDILELHELLKQGVIKPIDLVNECFNIDIIDETFLRFGVK